MKNSRIILFVLIIVSMNSFAKWEQAGLTGKVITAIAASQSLGNVVFAGTAEGGVYMRTGNGTFMPLYTAGQDSFPDGLRMYIRVLEVFGAYLFAATDSGLYAYLNFFGNVPRWQKVPGFPAMGRPSALAFTALDTTLYAALQSEIMISTDYGFTWRPCSTRTFLPPTQRMPWYTSLAFWRGINASSQVGASMQSFGGVINSIDRGKTWQVISNTNMVSSVQSLATQAHSPLPRLFAVTPSGLFWTEDLDTGVWSPLDPQLKIGTPRSAYFSYHGTSHAADLFASTDSGVCILSDLVKPGEWTLSLPVNAVKVVSILANDPTEWFAATVNGVYRFTQDPATARPFTMQKSLSVSQHNKTSLYTLDGRAVGGPQQFHRGLYVVKDVAGKTAIRMLMY